MDEQVIDDLYARATSKGYKKSRQEFISLLHSDDDVMNDMYSYVQSKGYRKDISDFKRLVGATAQAPVAAPVKKKDITELPSEDGSLVSPTSVSPKKPATISPLISSADDSSFGGTLSQVAQKAQGMPRAPELPSKPVRRTDETPKETPYFTGAIGEILSLMDSPITPYGALGIGDFIDDIGRAVDAGLNQGALVTPSNVLMTKGSKASSEQIKKYIAASKDLERLGASDEMMQFSKTYEEEGKGVYGFLKGLAQNPLLLPEIMISSFAALLNPSSAASAGTVTGGFTAVGAAGGLGVPGATAGALASVPWAMAAAGTTLETGLTFAELLQEKLKERNLDFTEENVKTILEDQEALNSIRAKSIARGATIGIIDGFTGRLAGKVGAKLAKNTPAGKVKAGLASSGIEMVGGSTGEAAGRLVAGQEMDVAEIGLEGAAEGPMAIADVTAELLRKPIYEINGERRNEADVEFLIENADPDELYQMNIKIKNDVKGYEKRIQDVIVDNQLKKEIKQANPDANDTTIEELFILEKELQKFEGSKTQSGKDRAAQIRSQIKTVQEDAIQEQAAGQVPVQSGTGVSQEVAQGVPQAEPQVTAQEGVQEEVIADDNLQEMGTQIGDLIETLNVFNQGLRNEGTSNEKRAATRSANKAFKKLGDFFGFTYGARETQEQADKQDALSRLTTMLNQEEYADVNELMTAYKNDKSQGVKSPVVNDVDTVLGIAPEVSSKTQPEITRDLVRALNDEQIAGVYEEIPVNLLPMAEGVSNQDAVFEAYSKAKESGRNPELVKTIEEKIYENLPTERVQLQPGAVRPEAQATIEPAELEGPERRSPKREQVKSSIQRIANAGLLRSAETGQATITEQEIDAQMALTDAMARVWQETSGKDDFYETFFEDVKEGDIETIKQKGGALFQDDKVPQRPISRVSLGVFELPEFQKMKDLMVAPQSISDLMKSRGKQIEKDIINTVLSYDKYKGQKRISFNEFKDDVETQLMKLERINTNTYASYGKDNLGDNQNYGKSETIIFNSPIDHGQFGHFRGDFMKGNLEAKTWNIRQVPNTEQYVAIDADMPAGVEQNEIAQYVGTAGPLDDVERWVSDRNSITDKEINKGLFGHIRNWFNASTGVYTLAELQSDYFQKNKANDLYASRISRDEVAQYVNENFRKKLDQETSDKLKEELGIVTRIEETSEEIIISAFSKSEPDVLIVRKRFSKSSTTPTAGYTLIEESEPYAVAEASALLAQRYETLAAKRRAIQDEYEAKRDGLKKEEYKYIDKRVEEIKKSEAGNLMLSQFVASQKVHELRLFREALKHAADKGATELWFPTPYTIAVIEGYVSSTGNAPYEVVEGNSDRLDVGDIIDYGGTEMIVLDATSITIVASPREEVSIFNIYDLREEEASNRVSELEYDLERQVEDIDAITREEAEAYSKDEWMANAVAEKLQEYFEQNPDEETVAWRDIEDDVSNYVTDYYNSMSVEDVLGWAGEVYVEGDLVYAVESRRGTESFGQPSEYESDVDESDFKDNLSDDQSTVVKKYDELGEMIKKMRPDAEVVTDDNGKRWIKTSITNADASNPIIAFQDEGGKIKGAIDFSNDNKASVYVFDGADISTLAHEMSGHLGRRVLEKLAATDERFAKDYETAKKWAGVKDNQWTRGAEEKWARGFEKYLRSGKAPSKALTSVFQKLRNWLTNIYKTIKGSSIDINLTPSIVSVFDNLLATKEERGQAKAPEATRVAEVEVAEEFTPMRVEDLDSDTFTRNNAIDYEEDVREDSNGREYPYLSSITVEARDADGDTIGSITRLADEDGTLSFTAEDVDGTEIGRGNAYDTLGEVRAALVAQVNKQRKKEFDKEQKVNAKEREKAKAREAAKKKAKEPRVEEEVVEEVRGKLDELLELDPVQRSTGQKVLDGLDGLIKDIEKFEKGTLGVNIALPIMKTILKSIRALVKGGMALNNAIKKAAKDNNVSTRDVVNGINAISQILPIQEQYDALMAKADALIARQKSRNVEEKKIVSNLDTMVRNSDVYKNATDAQRKIMEREARAKMGVDPRKAASIGRVIGVLKDITNVSREEKLQIISRIRELSRDVAKDLAQEIKDLNKKGKITLTQSANIIARFGKVNLLSEISVTNFVNHMTKVFADAEYANKLSTANTMRSQIRKLSKSKEKAANLRDLGTKFSKIDPSMVDNIDDYNAIATLIKDSIRGSSIRGAEVKFSNMIKESKAVEYINKTMEEQQQKLFDMRVAEVQSLLGVDVSDLTYEQLAEMLDSKEPMTKDNEKLVRSAINKAFDIYSSLIEESIKTGKDVFTGEDVEYTPNQKKVVKEFIDMDLNLLKPKQALEAVDALMNFLQNQSIAKMQSVVAKHNGMKNAEMLEKKGIKAKPIRKYFSKGLGRLLIEQTANLNILFERMFGGFTRGGLVKEAIGVTDIKNGKSKAQSESNSVVKQYVDKFYKSTPYLKPFNDAFNNTERGMVAFMMRNVIGNEAEMRAEFNRRKELIKESIEALSQGNESEVAKATVYKEVYDDILADSKTIDDVVDKANVLNVDAVKFWQNEWDSKYEELSDVALGVYNKILDKDINYNPDRYSKLSSDTGDVELSTEDMTFIFNSGNSPIYKRETGVLMAATRPKSLPRNEKSGETNRYIDLSFDSNNANSYYDALVDINTAAPIRQVESALNSSAFKRIVPEANDRKLLENRVKLYVNNIRKKNPFSDDEFSKAVKGLNRIAAIGVGQALGGVFQPIKQTIPIAVNTLINAGDLDMASVFSEAKQAFINKSGYAIANRGIESQAQIGTLNKMIDEAASSKPEQAFRAIEKVNNWWLKNLLVRFDVAIARASWVTYYEQSLKKQGIDTANIDYNTHELNADAADYAQRQVDRQQNVSDADLAGALLSSKDPAKQLAVKILMPFASFRMNQSARVGADVSTLTNSTSTIEDKKVAARSLAGFAAEMVTFRILSVGVGLLIAEAVKAVMGRDDDEEKDKKKMDSIIKGQLTNTVADVFSPMPLIDKAVQMGASKVLDATQDALEIDEEERLEIYSGNKQDFFQSLGLLGIAGERAYQLYEMATLSSGFAFEDRYGNVKYLTEEDREAIGMLIPIAIISNIGLTPSEVNSVVRSSLSDAKKAAKKDEKDSNIVKSMNKEDMKRYYPELYNQLHGPASPTYELEQIKKQMRKEQEQLTRQMKDEMYR
jgi:hypothetical protein